MAVRRRESNPKRGFETLADKVGRGSMPQATPACGGERKPTSRLERINPSLSARRKAERNRFCGDFRDGCEKEGVEPESFRSSVPGKAVDGDFLLAIFRQITIF